MNANARRLLGEVLELPSADRAELFERLGARLEAEQGDEPSGVSEAWRAEIARRIARIDAGDTQLVAIEDLERELWDRMEGR